jgi:hypothetical protein
MDELKKEIKLFFKDLIFEESQHKYYLQGKPLYKSVSNLIKDFYIPFDEDFVSKNKALKEGLKPQDYLDEWHKKRDKSLFIGKQAHLFGELYAFNRNLRPKTNFDIAIMKFWNDLPSHVIPLITELPMYHKVKLYGGTADCILLNTETNNLIIIDYKTNEDLFKNFKGQKLLERFSGYLDTPFNKYQIQLSYYKLLLEQTGYFVSTTKIVWLKPDGNYELFDTKDLTQYLR